MTDARQPIAMADVTPSRWAQFHDEMLGQDIEILEKAEKLGDLRDRMYRRRDPGLIREIAGLCGELADAAEDYKEWLEAQLKKAKVE